MNSNQKVHLYSKHQPNPTETLYKKISSFQTLNQMADRYATIPPQEEAEDKNKLQIILCIFYVKEFLKKTCNVHLSSVTSTKVITTLIKFSEILTVLQ